MKKLTILLFVFVLFGNVSFSQDQWYRTNGPTGGPIHSVYEKSSTKIFIGTNSGVYKSVNSGALFTPIGLYDNQIIKITGLNNMLFALDGNYLLFRSSDDGATWKDITTTNMDGLYVYNGILFATESFGGVYKSTNNGDSWVLLNNGLPSDGYQIASFGSFIYGYRSFSANLIYRSADNGNSWSVLNNDLPAFDGVNSFGSFNNLLFVNLVTAAGSMLYKSSNSGVNWTKLNNWDPLDYVNSFVQSGTYLAASVNGKGIYRTNDKGASWSLSNTGLNSISSIVLTKGASKIYASINEYFMRGSLYQSSNNAGTWTELKNGLTTGNVVDMVIMNNNVLAATTNGLYKSTNQGTNWSLSNSGLAGLSVSSLARKENTSTVYAGTSDSGLYVSSNFGASWKHTTFNTENVTAISINGTYIFIGVQNNGVYVSSDNGITWTLTLSSSRTTALASKGKYVYAGWRNSHGKPHGGIYASSDKGLNWIACIAPDAPVSSIGIFDNNNVIMSSDSVYISTNFGSIWNAAKSGTIIASPSDLVVMGYGDVYVANANGVAGSYNYGKTWEMVSYGLLSKNCKIITGDMNTLYVSPPYFGVWRLPLAKNNLTTLNTDNGALPKSYSLSQNYPNPFNPTTNIQYEIPYDGNVQITVYDAIGRNVETLVNALQTAGRYSVVWNAAKYSSGVYYCKMETGSFSETRKLVLMK